ncbi:ATP-binding cassette domain-containing protein [Streptomyces guryensis]|uniref:ATP-binding cassette domain-containing protein n=1 Tax=Streptomyces guryensis TaxID=2886947 RepID=A0A9Q3VRE8_9ACTN|nr:ATP-binding cassette domain-containing protein [Streptomyces guryensis]MCD9876422.1 ATP-binding cassette domain-containing protein [Streptomyces guryensis]
MHALVGENGAGKSTLVRILSGVLTADAGTMRSAPDTRVAVVSQELSLFPDLTVRENLFPQGPRGASACSTGARWTGQPGRSRPNRGWTSPSALSSVNSTWRTCS